MKATCGAKQRNGDGCGAVATRRRLHGRARPDPGNPMHEERPHARRVLLAGGERLRKLPLGAFMARNRPDGDLPSEI